MAYIENTNYKYMIAHRTCERVKSILKEYVKDFRYRYKLTIYTMDFYVGIECEQYCSGGNILYGFCNLIRIDTDSCRIESFLPYQQARLRIENDVNKATIETAISNVKLILQDMDGR